MTAATLEFASPDCDRERPLRARETVPRRPLDEREPLTTAFLPVALQDTTITPILVAHDRPELRHARVPDATADGEFVYAPRLRHLVP